MVNLKTMNLLDKPISPDALMNAVMDDQDRLSIDFSSQASREAKLLKESWQAAILGQGFEKYVAPCFLEVKSKDDSADFYLRVEENSYAFQNVMVVSNQRRMGDELRAAESMLRQGLLPTKLVTKEKIDHNRVTMSELIAIQIKKKYRKYGAQSPNLNLCIYLDINGGEVNFSELRVELIEYRELFGSIWLTAVDLRGPNGYVGTLYVSPLVKMGVIDGWGKIDYRCRKIPIFLVTPKD